MKRLGYDIGGTNIAAGLLDENNRLIEKASLPFPRGKGTGAVIEVCRALYETLLSRTSLKESDISGVGAAVPGSVDLKKGLVIDAHNLDFHQTPLVQLLEEAFQGLSFSQTVKSLQGQRL